MTTYIPFAPVYDPSQPPWTSTVTLDGNGYVLTAWWSLYAQRWYVLLTSDAGARVFFKPMIGSPPPGELADLVWETGEPGASGSVVAGLSGSVVSGSVIIPLPASSQTGEVIATSASPLDVGVPVGGIVEFTVTGATPAGYNGIYECVILGDFSFSYPLTTNPGNPLTTNPGTPAAVKGYYSPDINLVDGYFTTSTLVWRPSAGWFEVNP